MCTDLNNVELQDMASIEVSSIKHHHCTSQRRQYDFSSRLLCKQRRRRNKKTYLSSVCHHHHSPSSSQVHQQQKCLLSIYAYYFYTQYVCILTIALPFYRYSISTDVFHHRKKGVVLSLTFFAVK